MTAWNCIYGIGTAITAIWFALSMFEMREWDSIQWPMVFFGIATWPVIWTFAAGMIIYYEIYRRGRC